MAVEEGKPPGRRRRWRSSISGQLTSQHPSGPSYIMMAESILSKLDLGFVKESDYSGMGCTEQAAAMMQQAVQLQSLSRRRGSEVHMGVRQRPAVLRCHAAEWEHCEHTFFVERIHFLVRFAGRFSSMGCRGDAGRACIGKLAVAQALW